MRNAECIICMTTKRGRKFTFRKRGDTWIQRTPAGKIYRMTAEQVLSHVLPLLANKHWGTTVTVISKRKTK